MDKITKSGIQKIAVFRALQLGDLLCSVPAIRALKHVNKNSEITLLGLPWAETFVQRFSHYFSGFIHFPGFPGLPEQSFNPNKIIPFLIKMRMERFDLILQMHGNGSIVNPFMKLLGSKKTAGFYEKSRYCPDENLYMPYPENGTEVERHLQLMQHLGVKGGSSELEFPIFKEDRQEFTKLCKQVGLKPKEYICIHPGGRDKKRWWSPDKFAFIADKIAEKGYKILLTGTLEERPLTDAVIGHMNFPAINLGGKTDLGTLAALIENAKMILSNDTGVSHIAAAVKTPSVVIFLTSDPARWAPDNRKLHHIILPEESANKEFVLWNTEQVLLYTDKINFNKSA
jgi:ADP-heptose:LPS heptosyltransferase